MSFSHYHGILYFSLQIFDLQFGKLHQRIRTQGGLQMERNSLKASKCSPHLLNYNTISSPLDFLTNKSRNHTNAIFFNPNAPCRITTSKVSQSTPSRSLQLNLASSTTLCTSLLLQIPCSHSLPTPHIYNNDQIRGVFRIKLNINDGIFLAKIVNVSLVNVPSFYKNCWEPSVVKYFRKNLHLRSFIWF